MSFRVRPIKKKQNKTWGKVLLFLKNNKKALILSLLSLILGLMFLRFVFGGGGLVQNTRNLLFNGPLKTDEYGHTNIVFLGIAGKNEPGGHLSDSIMLASLDPKASTLSLLSLPRDLFVPSPIGDRKINEIFAAARFKAKESDSAGINAVKKAISDFTGIEVHYGAVIDFRMFEEVIDALGGVEVFVPNDIVDPFFPDDNYGYRMFVLRKGKQKLDGKIALQYARSRKTTSDYDRAQRQQMLLQAMIERALDLGVLGNPEKIKSLYDIYKKNVATDMNIVELLALAKVGIGLGGGDQIVHHVLNDDPNQPGGLLYAPAREFYAGQFVLLPENLTDTKTFLHLTLSEPEIVQENAQISVLNGSKISGKANEVASRLRRIGFHVIDVGNFESEKPIFRSYIRDFTSGKKPKSLAVLKELYELGMIETVPADQIPADNLTDFELILGTN